MGALVQIVAMLLLNNMKKIFGFSIVVLFLLVSTYEQALAQTILRPFGGKTGGIQNVCLCSDSLLLSYQPLKSGGGGANSQISGRTGGFSGGGAGGFSGGSSGSSGGSQSLDLIWMLGVTNTYMNYNFSMQGYYTLLNYFPYGICLVYEGESCTTEGNPRGTIWNEGTGGIPAMSV